MILVDTSVWVDHLRHGDTILAGLLQSCLVLVHPFIIGELALGGLHPNTQILTLLQALPEASVATDSEVLFLIKIGRASCREECRSRWSPYH